MQFENNKDIQLNDKEKKYGRFCFTDTQMQGYIDTEDFAALKEVRKGSAPLSKTLAEHIAKGMLKWAKDNGATHYCHWFQPINSTTVGKQNNFLKSIGKGKVISDFTSSSLLQGEGDASSFQTGGLRSTFEARGVSEWDVLSPVFIRENGKQRTLYIPTKFSSGSGEALDMKTPLLRSINALSKQAGNLLCKVEGASNYGRVKVNVGAEQEFFLVQSEYYNKRPDLRLTGRTLIGAMAAAGYYSPQHYYANLEEKIQSFMTDVNEKLERIGVLICTQHKEAAPNQFEMVLTYGSANIICDQNLIMNEIISQVAEQYGLTLLLHEKPYKGVNGSGKHTNWSIANKDGENLFSPGKNGEYSLRFLLMLSVFVKAVDEYGDLLRASIASYSNDLRLSAGEAPPSTISVFLGEQLTKILSSSPDAILNAHIKASDAIVSDRNRTSPIAFTGNKFEFRATGSATPLSLATTMLNSIYAAALNEVNEQIHASSLSDDQIAKLIYDIFSKHSRVVYNDNCYDKAWEKESRERGLLNARYTPSALSFYTNDKYVKMLTELGIYTADELKSRILVYTQSYVNSVKLEAQVLLEMLKKGVIPTVRDEVAKNYAFNAKSNVSTYHYFTRSLEENFIVLCRLTKDIEEALENVKDLSASSIDDAEQIRSLIAPTLEKIREVTDKIEESIPSEAWPYPNYERLLFSL